MPIPLLTFTADVTQALRLAVWVNQLDNSVYEQEPMVRAVRILGADLQANFKGEGSYGNRKWQSLTMMTQDLRETRGYPRAHPILQQSGRLKFMSSDVFAQWRIGANYQPSDGKGTTMAASIGRGFFSARLTGPKSLNHSGGKMSDVASQKEFFLPARPFFYIPQRSLPKMVDAYVDGVMSHWASSSRSARHTGRTFMINPNANTQRGKVQV